MMRILVYGAVAGLVAQSTATARMDRASFDPVNDAPAAVMLSVVMRDGTEEVGVGLPFWVTSGCFVATADHVLRGTGSSTQPKSVTIARRVRNDDGSTVTKTLNADGVGPHDLVADVAVFPISLDRQECGKWGSTKRVVRGQQFYFIGKNGEWYVPTTSSTFNSAIRQGLLFDGMEAVGSMSGAPVYGDKGVAGLVINRYGSTTALVAPIEKAIALLMGKTQRADDAVMRVIDFGLASALGTAYVKRNQEQFEADNASLDDKGEAYFEDAVLSRRGDVNDEDLWTEPPTIYVLWAQEGRGGGNHSEQLLAGFLLHDGRYPLKPDFEIQVGWRGHGYISTPVEDAISDSGSIRGLNGAYLKSRYIKFPGCLSNGTMSDCSVEAVFNYGYCPMNAKGKLAWFSTETGSEAQWKYELASESYLGVHLSATWSWDITASATKTMIDAGLTPGSTVAGFEIGTITNQKLATAYGLKIGDVLFSMDGTVASSVTDFQCLLGEKLDSAAPDNGTVVRDVNLGVFKKDSGELKIVRILTRLFMPDD